MKPTLTEQQAKQADPRRWLHQLRVRSEAYDAVASGGRGCAAVTKPVAEVMEQWRRSLNLSQRGLAVRARVVFGRYRHFIYDGLRLDPDEMERLLQALLSRAEQLGSESS